MEDNNKLSYFFLGLGLGLSAGLLFAPNSGSETRQLLLDKADDGKDYLQRRGDVVRESAGALVDKGRTALSKQRELLNAAVEAGKQAYREAVSPQAPGIQPGSAT